MRLDAQAVGFGLGRIQRLAERSHFTAVCGVGLYAFEFRFRIAGGGAGAAQFGFKLGRFVWGCLHFIAGGSAFAKLAAQPPAKPAKDDRGDRE